MSVALVVGTFTPSVLLAVARRLGHLAAVGVELHEQPVSSSPGQFRSLLAGDLDLVLTSPDNVAAYRFIPANPLGRTADVRIVSTIDRGTGLGLYGTPGSTTADLATARIGVDVPTSGFAVALYALADSFGLTRDALQLVTLGSTPRRLEALLNGACDATMLNAGNELLAEAAGCTRLAGLTERFAPYCSTVLAVAGEDHLEDAIRVASALRATARDIVSGSASDTARTVAADVLGLDPELADRYVARLCDPDEGLIVSDAPDLAALATVIELRQRFLPGDVNGVDPLADALRPSTGLVAVPSAAGG